MSGDFRDALRGLSDTFRTLSEVMRSVLRDVDWRDVEEQMDRQMAARARPDDPKSRPWLETGDMKPAERTPFWPYLPDPRKRRGRPKGGVADDDALFAEIDERIAATGEAVQTAVTSILRERGEDSGLNHANYIADLYRLRAK